MHEVLVNRLGGLSLPRKSVVRLTDRPDMTLDVYRGRKRTMQEQQQQKHGPSMFAVKAKIYGVLHGPSLLAVKANIYGVLYNQSSCIALDETSSYWPAPKSS